jgi:hypothetical protein
MLHPLIGRFTTRDPRGYVDGMGLYAYVRARPVQSHDPLGRAAEEKADLVASDPAGGLKDVAWLVIYVYHRNPAAKCGDTTLVGVAYVFAQCGATVGEGCIWPVRIFGPEHLGDYRNKTLWEGVHEGFTKVVVEIWTDH